MLILTSRYKACTKQNILESRDTIQAEIIYWITGIKPDRQKHCAPNFLRIDNNPGCFFSMYKGMIQFVDFAYKYFGYKHSLNCFDLTMLRYNCDYASALRLINQHFGLGLAGGKKLEINYKQVEKFKDVSLNRVSTRRKNWKPLKYKFKVFEEWPESYLDYWSAYNINEELLKQHNVLPIHSYKRGNRQIAKASIKDPVFAYKINSIKDVDDTGYKIYRPLASKEHKWRTNTNVYHIQGFNKLFPNIIHIKDGYVYLNDGLKVSSNAYNVKPTHSNRLIITKSLKDVMVLDSLGYDAIAPQAEGHSLPVDMINFLRFIYTEIYIFYDNDQSGIQAAAKTADKYDLKSIMIPEHLGYKDISDYLKANGNVSTQDLMNTLLDGTTGHIPEQSTDVHKRGYSKDNKSELGGLPF